MLRKVAIVATLWLLSALCASAQGTRRDGIAVSTFGPYLRPIPGGVVRVCQSGSTGVGNCTPLQAIYSDIALTVPITGSTFSVDADGSYTYYAATGILVDEVLSGSGVVAEKLQNIPIGVASAGTVTSFSAGNLSPLFTSNVATATSTPALTFSLSNAAANTVFGRCTGSLGAPSFCSIVNAMMPAPGSTNSIIYNSSSLFASSTDLTWDDTTKTFSVKNTGTNNIRLLSDAAAGKIIFGSGTAPFIHDVTDWQFSSADDSDFRFGFAASETAVFKLCAPTGACGVAGQALLGIASGSGDLSLNDGSSAAGTFLGPKIRADVGTPEGAITARVGSLYLRADGAVGTSLYVKETGTGNTGWGIVGPQIQTCGTAAAGSSATCSETDISDSAKVVVGTVALSSGTPSTAAVTSMPAFSGTETYACTVTNQTTAANGVKAINVSATAFTITGPNTVTDVISYHCVGN